LAPSLEQSRVQLWVTLVETPRIAWATITTM
jgi:hypothetical protein